MGFLEEKIFTRTLSFYKCFVKKVVVYSDAVFGSSRMHDENMYSSASLIQHSNGTWHRDFQPVML